MPFVSILSTHRISPAGNSCRYITKTVADEVSIKELGDDPEPFAIAEALMYADGKAIVDVQDMTLRMKGYTKTVSRSLDSRQSEPVFTGERVSGSLPPVRPHVLLASDTPHLIAIASSPGCQRRRIRFSIASYRRQSSRGS